MAALQVRSSFGDLGGVRPPLATMSGGAAVTGSGSWMNVAAPATTIIQDPETWRLGRGAGGRGARLGHGRAGIRRAAVSVVGRELVVGVAGRLQLERGVFHVEVAGQARLQRVEQLGGVTVVEAGAVDHHVGGQHG
jgi:hypothetical protein